VEQSKLEILGFGLKSNSVVEATPSGAAVVVSAAPLDHADPQSDSGHSDRDPFDRADHLPGGASPDSNSPLECSPASASNHICWAQSTDPFRTPCSSSTLSSYSLCQQTWPSACGSSGADSGMATPMVGTRLGAGDAASHREPKPTKDFRISKFSFNWQKVYKFITSKKD